MYILGVRPEFIKVANNKGIEAEIYSSLPTGSETTVKLKINDYIITSVLYGDVYSYLFKQIVSSVVLMLFISVAVPSISLVGHLGGMIGGFVATFVLEKIDSKKERIIN